MKRSVIVVIGATLFFAALGLDYVLPQVSVVEVVGVEVKRSDEEQGTRDVYIIHTQLIDGGVVRFFRNEDAWRYLKFDSATLHAHVTGLSREGSVEAVGILHHGWRIPVSSKFPKAISAWPVKPSYQHLSLFNIAVIELLGAAALLASRAVHRARNRVAAALERRAEERAQEAACRAVPQVINAGHEDWLLRDGPHSGRPSDPGEGA